MKLRYQLALALLPMLISCSKPPVAPTPAGEAPAPQAAQTTATPAVSASTSTTETSGEPSPAGLIAGQDYILIEDGQPFAPVKGKIEVAEVFNYACPACGAFKPFLEKWRQKLPSDVNLTYVAADFRPDFVPYARAYFAAESLGLVEKTHDAVYDAIQVQHSLPGEGEPADEARIAAFYAKFGANAASFQQLMDSFAITTRLAAARQFIMHSQVSGTPSLVIDGRFLVKGKTLDERFRIADQLIARARAK